MSAEPDVMPLSEPHVGENGSAWGALLSAAFGAAAFGVLTDLSEASPRISRLLNWYHPSGSLSGVAVSAVMVWVIAWAALHACWKGKRLVREKLLLTLTTLLALLAVIATFPPFYELF